MAPEEVAVDRLRIGAVSYLNTKPLIHDLDRLAPDAELILDYPSRLADRLKAGALDVALVPIVEYTTTISTNTTNTIARITVLFMSVSRRLVM